MATLTPAQVSFIQGAADARGASFAPPYEFLDASIVGAQQDLLAIEVRVIATGAVFNNAQKSNGWQTDDSIFQALVTTILTHLEKTISLHG